MEQQYLDSAFVRSEELCKSRRETKKGLQIYQTPSSMFTTPIMRKPDPITKLFCSHPKYIKAKLYFPRSF